MESILNRAYLRQHCHECGHSYTLTLYGILQEQRLKGAWHNLQDRDVTDADTRHVLESIPHDALEDLESAWGRVVAAFRAAGFDLRVSPAGEEERVHQH